MPNLQYTHEQLLRLRDSPLVNKPDDLPPIEQWIEYVYVDIEGSRERLRIPHSESTQQQQQTQQQQKDSGPRRLQRQNGGDASPMGNFSTGQRPSLTQTRPAVSRSGDDIVLGPPKTAFASSRTLARLTEMGDKAGAPSSNDATPGDEPDGAPARILGERQSNRKSMNANEVEGRANRESWTGARERRMLAEQDENKTEGGERNGRYSNRRDRDREQDGERRNGHGEKQDRRWGNRDDRVQNGERQGGWRERERERRDRGFARPTQDEKEPEWFDEPAASKRDEGEIGMGTARTQEDFQNWKEMMNARNRAQTEESTTPPIGIALAKEAAPSKPSVPLKLDGILDKPLGGWSEPKPLEAQLDSVPTLAKAAPAPAAGRGKSSRFASMFKKPEEAQIPASDVTRVQQLANEAVSGSSEDKEGFQRILQMLGGTGSGGIGLGQAMSPVEPTSPPPRSATNGTRQRSRFFDSAPKSPERIQSPPQASFHTQVSSGENDFVQGKRISTEPLDSVFGSKLPVNQIQEQPRRSQVSVSATSPEPMPAMFGVNDQGPPGGRAQERAMNDAPSRGSAIPDLNIQNLLATQRAQRQQAPANKDSEFLLGLLQGSTSMPSSQHARPGRDFPLWLEQPPEPHAHKARQPPPPGLLDEHLLRNVQQDMSRLEQQQQFMPNDIPSRRTSQRAPPPGFDEQNIFMQQQHHHHRQFIEPPQHQQPPQQRRMTGHHQALPPVQTQQPQLQPEFPFLQSPSGAGGHHQGPPPGFPPNMRHPQSFANIPNIFQAPKPQPQQPQQQREPPGFGGMMQNLSPLNPPPGFGAMKGMPPGMLGQMRSPTEGIPGGAAGYRGNGRRFDGFEVMGQRR